MNEIFSDESFNINGKLNFKNDEDYKKFLSALEIAQAEGKVVPVEGVTSVLTEVSGVFGKYPIGIHDNISDFLIGPVKQKVDFPVKIGCEEKSIPFYRYNTTENLILESIEGSVINLKLTYNPSTCKVSIDYKVNYSNATNTENLVESFSVTSAFLSSFYTDKDDERTTKEEANSFVKFINYLRYSESFFLRLLAVEKELNISFFSSEICNMTSEIKNDIEELYLLICKKQVLRLNAKLISTDKSIINTNETTPSLEVGEGLKITFTGEISYDIFGKKFLLKTANLIINAIVKDIQNEKDSTKILYGDTDTNPMYIAYTAFLTEAEAKAELEAIMHHEEKYINAKTVEEHTKRY
mgnify:FL=1